MTRKNFRVIMTLYKGGYHMISENKLTIDQENTIKKYVNSSIYDIQKLKTYLNIHDEVGADIFSYITKDTEQVYHPSKRLVRNYKLHNGFGFPVVSVDTFIRRIPFYFYEPDGKDKYHSDLMDLLDNYKEEKITALDHTVEPNYEPLYFLLEELFYEYQIPVEMIFNYVVIQTGSIKRYDIFEKWIAYLKLAREFGITDYCPKNILYAYNLALEKAGKAPILYPVEPVVGFHQFYIRAGLEILVGGEFPVDDYGEVVRRWILISVENEKYIHTYREIEHNNLLVELHIGINNHTKIYLVNPFEEQEKSKIYWYPIYFGPSVMEFDPSALKIYRKEMGVTQEDVANAVGVQLRTYQNWEAGNGSKPDGYSLIRIMNYLDIESVQFIIKNEVIQDDGFAKFKSGRPLSSFLNKDENAKERRN